MEPNSLTYHRRLADFATSPSSSPIWYVERNVGFHRQTIIARRITSASPNPTTWDAESNDPAEPVIEAFKRLSISLFLSNNRYRHKKSFYLHRKRGPLACRRILMKPCFPFIVHFGKIVRVAQNERGRDDVLH